MKKFISFLLCVLLMTALVIPASAEGEAFMVTPSTVTVKPGGTITLTVKTASVLNCVSFGVGLNLEKEGIKGVFTVESITLDGVPADAEQVKELGGLSVFPNKNALPGFAGMKVNGDDSPVEVPEATLGTITLKVSENAAEGTYTIGCEASIGYDRENDGIPATVNSVTVTVKNRTPGDVNGDGKVNSKDATRLLRYLAFDTDAVIDMGNSDVNGDNKVNSKDATRLLRYLAFDTDAVLQ